jgi:HipA-like protein
MASELIAVLDGRAVGVFRRDKGRLSFTYDEAWRTDASAYPLSLSMPLTATDHDHRAVDAFLWGRGLRGREREHRGRDPRERLQTRSTLIWGLGMSTRYQLIVVLQC